MESEIYQCMAITKRPAQAETRRRRIVCNIRDCFDSLEVIQRQGQKWRLPNQEVGNIIVNWHPQASGDGLPAKGDFHICDLEVTP
jgi:hypothetical protein